MLYKQIHVNTAINVITQKDNLFHGNYTIDPYQNCEFSCSYCDSSFDSIIYVKTNIIEILKKELNKLKKGRIIIGSVHDPYQKIEKKYKLTRDVIKIIKKNNFSCHILTKSDLILRDIDLLKSMDSIVTISIISNKSTIINNFEKNVSITKKRFKTVKKLNENGIKSGIAIIPILPYIVDEELEELIKYSKKNNAQYVLSKHLELKGDQKNIFFKNLENNYPNLLNKYKKLYQNSYIPKDDYINDFTKKIGRYCLKYNIKKSLF